jgi:hypothetical protein
VQHKNHIWPLIGPLVPRNDGVGIEAGGIARLYSMWKGKIHRKHLICSEGKPKGTFNPTKIADAVF